MPMAYQQESLATCVADIKPLLEQHWQEIALNQDMIKLNPDWQAYYDLEECGALKIFTARSDGKLVGYFVVLCRKHIHHVDHIVAFNDLLYLDKGYRKGFTGIKLMKFAEKCLKEDGVTFLVVSTKKHKPLDSLLEWLGYDHIENIYSKPLRG